MHVECSSKMRNAHPVGTFFVVRAKVINREDGPDFLYTSWQWPYEVMDAKSAKAFLDEGGWR